MTGDFLAEYRRRGWALVPIPAGEKGPRDQGWQTRQWQPSNFSADGNVGVILGPRSGELVDIDLDCPEALALADLYLPPTGAEFGRASKPRSHRLYISPGAVYESFADPDTGETVLELRARGATRGEHQTLIPPSIADDERREWHGNTIAPAVIETARLRRRVAYLAIGSLVRRYVSEIASERPGPDMPQLLYEADPPLGRKAFGWLGLPDPAAPHRYPQPRRELSREEVDLAELVAVIPNNCDWVEWNAIGMAIFDASGGSGQGGIVFDNFSVKSPKYDSHETAARWLHFNRSPPTKTGIGKLIKLALKAGWRPSPSRPQSEQRAS